jgi:hypothetical protein
MSSFRGSLIACYFSLSRRGTAGVLWIPQPGDLATPQTKRSSPRFEIIYWSLVGARRRRDQQRRRNRGKLRAKRLYHTIQVKWPEHPSITISISPKKTQKRQESNIIFNSFGHQTRDTSRPPLLQTTRIIVIHALLSAPRPIVPSPDKPPSRRNVLPSIDPLWKASQMFNHISNNPQPVPHLTAVFHNGQ